MIQFFTPLKNIELENFNIDFYEIIPGVNISNNQIIKKKFLSDRNKIMIGMIESQFIESCEVFLFFDYENDAEIFAGETNLQSLEHILLWVDDILKNLWLVKDNNVLCDTAFLIHDQITPLAEAASLRLQYQLTDSKGFIGKAVFNKEEIIEFSRKHDIIENHFYSKKSGSLSFILEKNFSRINRALIFVKQAREARNLAYKISNYCSAMETLFSTDNAELSHKLSERIAFFYKKELNPLETFKTIKKAYAIRSKLTHGDTLDTNTIDLLPELSKKIDNILRRSINRIFEEKELFEIFESPKNIIDSYFETLIFSTE
ncbi:hypothetical protein J2795_004225 [Chryseobacterium bernardetii]|uniref:Uncharacterized protein n=1 Tax=Chryseobacterium bernardetii TaxID=1241978 RepID=A0ACC6J0B8_9FLAO|nr:MULTISPECIES: HEPN domain-containing protein [Chryseobacterium]MDR6373037.1 hypothetical protein [Chryseobacterium vietnamense]MDR6443475.1 hypothetical protein [Chryseobacterium bernardetii]